MNKMFKAEDFIELGRKLQEQTAHNNNRVLERRAELVATIIGFNDVELPKRTIENIITLKSPNMKYNVTIKEDANETVVTIKEM